MARHPILHIPEAKQLKLFGWGVVATLAVGAPLLAAIETGPGISALASLVFSGSPTRAEAILSTWSSSDRILIGFANGLDYLFGVLLYCTLAIGCTWAARLRPSPQPSAAGIVLVWLSILAVLLDIPENTSYLLMVYGNTSSPLPQVARATSIPRFAIFSLCTGYILLVAIRARRMHA